MKTLIRVAAITLAFGAAQALAQTLPPPARPGHVPGVGESLPLSSKASNINSSDTTAGVAPTLPATGLGDDRTPQAYLREARSDLVAKGRTGQAQQAMEMAETRALDRSVVATQVSEPDGSRLVQQIHDARMALGHSDTASAIRLIDLALAQ
jgi:hypothetical protein